MSSPRDSRRRPAILVPSCGMATMATVLWTEYCIPFDDRDCMSQPGPSSSPANKLQIKSFPVAGFRNVVNNVDLRTCVFILENLKVGNR